jgi:gamma-glutamyltranspeptidase/glutathione hydrolase
VLAPRVHHQHLPDQVEYENGGLPAEVIDALRERGQNPVEREGMSGDAELIIVRDRGRRLEGQADPRRGGEAVGW